MSRNLLAVQEELPFRKNACDAQFVIHPFAMLKFCNQPVAQPSSASRITNHASRTMHYAHTDYALRFTHHAP
jgi:hypothetical protein